MRARNRETEGKIVRVRVRNRQTEGVTKRKKKKTGKSLEIINYKFYFEIKIILS